MLLLIDNFDSFTYNLSHEFQILGLEVKVVRNNVITVKESLALKPYFIVIGPGPGNPSNAGISNELILSAAGKIPILGICLGHQCIAEVYGGKVVRAKEPFHGKTSNIYHDSKGLFSYSPKEFIAMRYHSLIVENESLPSCLEVSAETFSKEIMGLRHKNYPIEGLQFHPESILTLEGRGLLKTFVKQNSYTDLM